MIGLDEDGTLVEDLHQVVGSDDAFKGAFWEVVEIEERTVEINYYIYYRLVG